MWEEIGVLIDETDLPTLWWYSRDIRVAEPNHSRLQRDEASDRLQEGCFSRSGWPDHGTVSATRHGERHVVERELAESRRQSIDRNHESLTRRDAARAKRRSAARRAIRAPRRQAARHPSPGW